VLHSEGSGSALASSPPVSLLESATSLESSLPHAGVSKNKCPSRSQREREAMSLRSRARVRGRTLVSLGFSNTCGGALRRFVQR